MGAPPAMIYQPMLAVSWDEPFSDPRWMFEPKLDGIRAVAEINGDQVVVRSRTSRIITDSYPELAVLVGRRCVLDGEIVAYDDIGRPSFERLQGRIHLRGQRAAEATATIPIGYAVFDVLELDGRSLIGDPLEQRTAALAAMDLPDRVVRVDQIREHGNLLFDAVAEAGMEGVVAKRRGSLYRPGTRSSDWRKIPHVRRVRAVVGGFTPGEGGRSGQFGALLVGMWDGERLRWAGSVGTGFDGRTLRAIRAALEEMRRPDPPFHPDAGFPREAVWVEPQLVAEIAFKEWTSTGRLRAPSFKGFSDRPVDEITWRAERGTDNDI